MSGFNLFCRRTISNSLYTLCDMQCLLSVLDGCINNMHSAAEASIRFENGRGVVDLGLKTRGVVGSKTSTDGGKSVIISYFCTLLDIMIFHGGPMTHPPQNLGS